MYLIADKIINRVVIAKKGEKVKILPCEHGHVLIIESELTGNRFPVLKSDLKENKV